VVKRSVHPDKQLFQYLSGALDEQSALKIESHLSACPDCAGMTSAVRAMRAEAADSPAEAHPSVSELASFFYSGPSHESGSPTARHVAMCRSCSDDLALYARAERLARDYKPAGEAGGEVPQAAWEMISDWEESSYAKPRPESEILSDELLTRLVHLLTERKDQILDMKRNIIESSASSEEALVPVFIIGRSGEFRGVEMFHREEGGAAGVLKHAESSGRFDNKTVHALLDFTGREPVVITEVIRRDAIELKRISRFGDEPDRANYFIIED